MAVEVSLNTPLAEALSNVVQPKLSEVGWSTGGLDDSALGEYIILMLVNGKTQEQIAAELSNDLLNLGPDDSGATDFAKWLFDQVDMLNTQINGDSVSSTQPAQAGQVIPAYHTEERHSRSDVSQGENSTAPDADMSEAMDDIQNGSIPTGPRSMRNAPKNGNKRLMGQLSKAMDRSGDALLHRVRPQQGTERINMHNRQPPKGPRNDQVRNQRVPPSLRSTSIPSNGIHNSVPTAPLMNTTPQQQMQLFAMLEEQARMMSQIFSPQQQNFMPAMSQPMINRNFQTGGQQNSQPGRSLFERVEKPPQRQTGNYNNRSQHSAQGRWKDHSQNGQDADVNQESTDGDVSSSMEVESSQKNPSELLATTICKFNLKCAKKDCPFAHQSPAAPPGITMDLSAECTFGARCQNRKCVMRHPSPAQKASHSASEDCRFFPNCTNPSCPFRHPTSLPMCKFGANCTREDCKFTHVNITCKFNPCLNPSCPYKHIEGQKKTNFGDKVWIAGKSQEKDHVSERKFVDDAAAEDEELIVPENIITSSSQPSTLGTEVVT